MEDKMKPDYVGLMDVSRQTGIAYWRIIYCHQSGAVPYPMKVANKYLYRNEDIDKIKKHFSIKEKQ